MAIVIGIVGASIFGVNAISAEDNQNYPPIIQKLVERFNLNQDEVVEVFQEAREERHQMMQEKIEERLNQAVTDGKITEEQKQAILAKKAEMQNKRAEFANLPREERWQAMNNFREEMRTWAQENNFDLKEIFGFGHKGMDGKHFGMGYEK
ncbi:hypothetical protein A2164_04195 [Candidatus Curtissbacteria bacterium RBG_13_35_7]|uniref:Uncharacterized protein n=1 Tax=Candidatus Curtissbacteria bacterium RBG_13_35_7 TaxID=1797705 RepID=A0A1F5G578_9BACT|nr:MAG: hypothetical protein A2164_04195 [Candidatus Curtissbacteria bacterium RBG_13_35_7]